MADVFEEFAKNDDFLSFKETSVIEGIYLSSVIEDDPFGKPGDKRMSIAFKCADGKERKLGSKSKRLAQEMRDANVQNGDKIQIKRTGDGFKTFYHVTKLTDGGGNSPTQTVDPDDVPF